MENFSCLIKGLCSGAYHVVVFCLRQAPHCYNPGDYVQSIYADRLRSPSDKQRMRTLFATMFGDKYPLHAFTGDYVITPSTKPHTCFFTSSSHQRNTSRRLNSHGDPR